mmetsp:Transcript_116864/g.337680  ORF Transcript_116864/g.337680 Transcript_116864/m.337680 type:complete len:228 (+) Transcript_116864:956-1639(+)
MGSKSSSESTASPVMFLTLLVNVLNKLLTRPGFDFTASFFSSASLSEPEDSDSTSSSALFQFSSSSESPTKDAFCAAVAAADSSRGLFFEKSSSSAIFLLYFPSPSHVRACLTFFVFSPPSASFFPFFALPFASSSSASPPSPDLLFCADAGRPFSGPFLSVAPFFAAAKFCWGFGRRASCASLSTLRRHSKKAASKSTCLMLKPFPKASATWDKNSFATALSNPSK